MLFASAMWLIPITADGLNIVEMTKHIVQSTAAHFDWVWQYFTLNPLVW